MRTDGQTDVTNLTMAFRNYANAPKSLDAEDKYLVKKKIRTQKPHDTNTSKPTVVRRYDTGEVAQSV